MTISSIGYPGTIDGVQWARYSENLGERERIQAGFTGTPVAGQTRQVAVAVGVAYAFGVLVTSNATQNVTFGNVSSGTRWDAVVIRRNWKPVTLPDGTTRYGTTTLEVVPGTSVQQIPATVKDSPGDVHDQPILLVQLTAGQTVPTAVVNLQGIYARHDHRKYVYSLTGSESDYLNSPDGEVWPDRGYFDITIPRWARHCSAEGKWLGVRNPGGGDASGALWLRFGTYDTQAVAYNTVGSEFSRYPFLTAADFYIPAALRGTTQRVYPMGSGNASPQISVQMDNLSAFVLDLDFAE